MNRVTDRKPYIEVKDVIVARSGIYTYTRAEILARGHKPARVKDFYDEFRPAAVIAMAAPLFDMVPVPDMEHTDIEIDYKNFHEIVSGMVGGPINIVAMPNGIDIGLQGKIAFFTEASYNYYKKGNKETSADYVSESVLVDDPDKVGYDLIMTKITSVNNVAITAMGRGGKDVRIKDSLVVPKLHSGWNAPEFSGREFDEMTGRRSMGLLKSFLKLGEGSKEKFSAIVKDSLASMKGAKTPEERQVIVDRVIDHIAEFSDSDMKSALQGVVRDSFAHPDEVLEHWKDSERIIDGIHARCVDADAALAAQVADAKPEEKEKEKEKEKPAEKDGDKDKKKKEEEEEEEKKKKAREKDSAAIFDDRLKALRDEIPGMIESSLKKALGLEGNQDSGKEHRALDAAPEMALLSDDPSFVLKGAFGSPAGY